MDQKQFEIVLRDAEARIKRLKTLYDQYFAGVERMEPTQKRREVEVILRELRSQQTRNTALKFRVNQLQARYNSFKTYWNRITRQIEEGTYKRDVLRAQRIRGGAAQRQAEPEEEQPRQDVYELDVDVDIESALGGLGQEGPPPAGAEQKSGPAGDITPFAQPIEASPVIRQRNFPAPGKKPTPPSAPGGAFSGGGPPPIEAKSTVSDAQMADIYERYVAAREGNSERVDNVKMASLAKSVRGMMPKLAKKHGGKKIDFEVVVKDGKVALKPVAK